jgi:hypothetical protein
MRNQCAILIISLSCLVIIILIVVSSIVFSIRKGEADEFNAGIYTRICNISNNNLVLLNFTNSQVDTTNQVECYYNSYDNSLSLSKNIKSLDSMFIYLLVTYLVCLLIAIVAGIVVLKVWYIHHEEVVPAHMRFRTRGREQACA